MCLFLSLSLLSWAELCCGKPRAACHQLSPWGVTPLVRGCGAPFIIWADHKNLTYLRTAKRLNACQVCWFLLFRRFNFSISYHPGSCNVKTNALSREIIPDTGQPEPANILPTTCQVGAFTGESRRSAKPFRKNLTLVKDTLPSDAMSPLQPVWLSFLGATQQDSPAIPEQVEPFPS